MRKGRDEEEDEDEEDEDEEVLPKPSTRYPMAPERFPTPSPSLSDLEDEAETKRFASVARARGRRSRFGASGRMNGGPQRRSAPVLSAPVYTRDKSSASDESSEEEMEQKKEVESTRAGPSGSTSGRASRSRSSSSVRSPFLFLKESS